MGPPCSFQVLFDGVPFVSVWEQGILLDGTVERVPLLGTNPVVPGEEGLVVIDQHVTQAFPRQDVETVVAVILDFDECHDQSEHRAEFRISNNLPFSVEGDVAVLRDVAKLPGGSTTGFDLDGNMASGFVGCDDVVMRDVASECGSDQSTAGEFRRDEVFTGLPDKLVATSCCHVPLVPQHTISQQLWIEDPILRRKKQAKR